MSLVSATERPLGWEKEDCSKAPGFGKDKCDPPNTGKGFRHPLPAVSMTRAPAAHNHFRIQGQRARKTMAKSWVMVKLERDGQIGNSQTANKGKRLLLTEQQLFLKESSEDWPGGGDSSNKHWPRDLQ